MGFYNQDDLPFYYDLAQKFAIDDRYFASVLGPTLPNRFYLMAATSFGHSTTGDPVPPGGYKPITGTIFDLLDSRRSLVGGLLSGRTPGGSFSAIGWSRHGPALPSCAGHSWQPQQAHRCRKLPQVAFVDPGSVG